MMRDGEQLGDGDPVQRARALIPLLNDAASRIEAAREMPADVLAALHAARMFRVMLPESLGGDEASLKTFSEVIEALSMGDASAAWVVSQGGGCAMGASFLQAQAAERWFGPADAALAWGAGIAGKAVEVNGGYRVTGTWAFASGSRHATLLGGHSFVFQADGSKRLRANGRQLDRTVLIRRDQAEISDVWNVMGLNGTGSDTFTVTDLFVPKADSIDREDDAERVERGALYALSATLAYGVGFASLQLGIARTMVNAVHDLAMTKTPRGAPSPLRENPVFQKELAEMEGRLRSARAYLHAAADEIQAIAVRDGELDLTARSDIKLASVHVIHDAVRVTEAAYRAAGSTAIFKDGPFERRLRDALSASQQTQARTQNFVTIGRILLDLEPDSVAFL